LLVSKKGTQYQVKTKPRKRLETGDAVKNYQTERGVFHWSEANIQVATKLENRADKDSLAIPWT